ncbi:hypothetical protein L484_024118 [Morus notabilis]|uniref:Uncharacterized protein n=1 Tax=Morus notabilis TaxID=981085 RepID=W9RQ39_9ROSA|nr:hypothetical protein L484_024118 [Morus notabilis]
MNSMFSCFDAVCADLLFPKTLRTFTSSSSQPNRVLISNDKAKTENGKGNKEPTPQKTKKQQQKIRSAPEFDGLNCFEAIVRY